MLTAWAIKGGALSHDALADRCAAFAAGFTVASIDEILLLEVARRAVAADEVPQRAPAGGQCILQGLADTGGEAGAAAGAEFTHWLGRVDAGAEQAFGGVDVADADHVGCIH